jgi:hypothetical protein
MDPVHSSVDHGRCQSTVHHGEGLGGGSPEDGRNGAPVCRTLPGLRKKGEGTAMILTGCRRGQWRGGNNWAAGRSPTSVWKEEEGRGGLSGRKGKRAGWLAMPAGPKSEENSFLNKNWIIKYSKVLKICSRRLRRNFDMGIFSKFF